MVQLLLLLLLVANRKLISKIQGLSRFRCASSFPLHLLFTIEIENKSQNEEKKRANWIPIIDKVRVRFLSTSTSFHFFPFRSGFHSIANPSNWTKKKPLLFWQIKCIRHSIAWYRLFLLITRPFLNFLWLGRYILNSKAKTYTQGKPFKSKHKIKKNELLHFFSRW